MKPKLKTFFLSFNKEYFDQIQACEDILEITLIAIHSENIKIDEAKKYFPQCCFEYVCQDGLFNHILQNDYKGYNQISTEFLDFFNNNKSMILRIFKERTDMLNIMNLYDSEVYLFDLCLNIWSIIKKLKPELCLFAIIPHELCEYICYSISKYLKIKSIIVDIDISDNGHFIMGNDIYDNNHYINNIYLDQLHNINSKILSQKTLISFNALLSQNHCYEQKKRINITDFNLFNLFLGIIARFIKFFIINNNQKFYSTFNFYGNTIAKKKCMHYKILQLEIFSLYQIYKTMKFLIKIEQKNYNYKNIKYIYFPLNLQPECTTTPQGGIYNNQYIAIKMLSKVLPKNWKIIIKEHPSMFRFKKWTLFGRIIDNIIRSKDFYQSILQLGNTVIVSRDSSTNELIKNAQIVATVTGTAGLEALLQNKPVFVFGFPWYKICKGIFYIKEQKDLENALELILNGKHDSSKNEDYVKALLLTMQEVSFPFYKHHEQNIIITDEEKSKMNSFRKMLGDFL